MKKGYILFASLALSLILVGCSDDGEMANYNTGRFGENEIGFYSSSSRAEAADLYDSNGFEVYATKSSDLTDFYVSKGSYVYDSEADTPDWGWNGTSYTWSNESADYPMIFYAYYPTTGEFTVVADTTGDTPTLTSEITINESSTQVDILGAYKSTSVIPVGGKLSLDFNHILSRVNLDIVAGSGMRLFIQSVKFCGLVNNNTYDFMTQTWSSIDSATAVRTNDYDYLVIDTENGPQQITNSIDNISNTNTELVATYSDLMLMPHTLDPWDTTEALSNARVEIIFRSTILNAAGVDSAEEDQIGYTDASTSGYDTSSLDDENTALFVKIAYPLVTGDDNTWSDGYGYNYVVTLGGSTTINGYFADDVFYDDDGEETELTIKHAEVGEPVTPTDIHFDITCNAWNLNDDDDL